MMFVCRSKDLLLQLCVILVKELKWLRVLVLGVSLAQSRLAVLHLSWVALMVDGLHPSTLFGRGYLK